jgi:NAD(P)-dependent dehydrogenase (short-subunit alcohol dehydrogenase family)
VIRDSYRGSGKLEGKAALITGGDSGIGRAVVRLGVGGWGGGVLRALRSKTTHTARTL